MKNIYVKAVPGRLVRHPETGEIVPESGMTVPRVSYWLRRLKDGDIVESASPKAKKEPAPTKKEE